MTTVAFKDGILAADSQMTNNGWSVGLCRKLFVLGGRAFAVTGDLALATAFAEALVEGKVGKDLPDMTSASRVIELLPTGVAMVHEEGGHFAVEDFTAFGSGSPAAMAAFHMGAPAVEAVRIASLVDPYTGGPVVAARWQDGTLYTWSGEHSTRHVPPPLLIEGNSK